MLYSRHVVDPKIVPREGHGISRSLIDADALRVLYRLHNHGYRAYLVGGGVRDLLLGRRPKDFDIGTDAHPYQIKKLFRNCWIIGRRFRLAHVRFGPTKVVEVATFRRLIVPGTETEPAVVDTPTDGPEVGTASPSGAPVVLGEGITLTSDAAPPGMLPRHPSKIVHDDNTFGTPEEDAFRRDFTINALFYDVGSFSIIDYTGGMDDLRAGIVRCIGDPNERFLEDPVRMMRAIVFAARLDFVVDAPVLAAIERHGAYIEHASPARVLEEVYKILRSGYAARTFAALDEAGLLQHLAPEFPTPLPHTLIEALERLDAYRTLTADVPPNLTNAVLLGTLVVPLGMMKQRVRRTRVDEDEKPAVRGGPSLGKLPLARKDLERLEHMLTMQPRLAEMEMHPRRQRGMVMRPSFADALTWMDIHGDAPDVVEHWQQVVIDQPPDEPRGREHPAGAAAAAVPDGPRDGRPSRRRRRGRRRGGSA